MICLVLVIATVAVYWRVRGFDFVNFDDPDYISENPMIRGGLTFKSVVWAFTHYYSGNWHPATWISLMLDCQIFGLHSGGSHLVNVAFHAANTVLLFILLHRLTGALWRSAIVAGLFALHPLHVESVAWIAERKDVLSTLFGLLSLMAYARYLKESKVQNPKSKVSYACALGFFALSLMAKPMLVTLPFVMLLLDIWPLQRVANSGWRTCLAPQFGRLALEKWPWFVLSVVSSVVTFFAQKTGGAVASIEYFPFSWRVTNAVISYSEYVWKACWPVHLAVFYPLAHEQPIGLLLGAIGFLLVTSAAAVMTIKRWPFLLVGWLWFLGTLVPVIGLVQVGGQAMADRYMYVPSIGLFIVIVWGVSELLRRSRMAMAAGSAAVVIVLVACAAATVFQLQYWQNSLVLFGHAVTATRDNALAHNNFGSALAATGRREDALAHYEEAVRIDPNNARYQNNFATGLVRAGQPDAAIEHYQAALRICPLYAEVYSNLGSVFLAQHRVSEAITNLYEAVRIDPGNSDTRDNLGNALSTAGKLDDAITQYSEAMRLNPTNATVRLNAGLALLKADRANEAAVQFAEAVKLNPDSAVSRYELGRQLFLQRQFPAALEQLEAAARLKPNYASAQFYLAAVYGEIGRFDEAVATANKALQSAQAAGQANLVTRAQEALETYKSRHPFRPNGANNN